MKLKLSLKVIKITNFNILKLYQDKKCLNLVQTKTKQRRLDGQEHTQRGLALIVIPISILS